MGVLKVSKEKIIIYAILICGAIISIGPFYWLVTTAFKLPKEVIVTPPTLFPLNPTLENFKQVLTMKNISFPRMYANSLLVGGVRTILIIFVASLLGYVLGKFKFRGRDAIFILILMVMMVPPQVILIPMFVLAKNLNWINSYQGLIIPGLLSPYAVFLLRQYVHNIPNELTDAARIDGCSEFGIYWRIVLPLIIPALAAVGIIKFMWEWETFLWPLVVSQSPDMFTIPVGISFLSTTHWVKHELVMAANTLAAIPMMIIFIILQKHIVEGITLTGLKE